MGKIIALANQKGGVGKTTSCVNLAAALAEARQQVLLVDLDPQGNATVGCGVDRSRVEMTINDVLLDRASVPQILTSVPAGFDVLPANSELTEAETTLLQLPLRERRLLKIISPLRSQYDYILIDCPPSLNMLTVNALVAADSVLIPMQCEYYALEGLTGLLRTIDQIGKTVNKRLSVEGVLRTMFDGRTSLAQQVSQQLQEHFGDKLYVTFIPRNIRLAEAPSYGLPGVTYDRNSNGAVAYMAVARELMTQRQQEMTWQREEQTA